MNQQFAPGITVAIPSIPPRAELLQRALRSVARQTHPAVAVSIAFDTNKEGAGPTRNRALAAVRTEWTAFLDDDDEMLPHHLSTLMDHAFVTGADVVWPWFDVVNGRDPFPGHEGRQLDPEDPHIFPIACLLRTRYAQRFSFPAPGATADWTGDDWPFWLQMHKSGAKFSHIAERTWLWHHDSYPNTSGLPTAW